MEQEKQTKLIAYALDFVSFLLEHNIRLERAILFGSIVTKEFDEESDVDIFLEAKEKEEDIQNLLAQFEKTIAENWKLKGIENPISLKIGKLEKWPQLRRNIQSHGILLYGKFKEIPEEIENYAFFSLNFEAIKRPQKVNIWRKLYGYTQKVKNKKYIQKGLIGELGGKRFDRGVVFIPSNKIKDFKDFLHKNKIKYKLIEIWTDSYKV